MNAPFLKIGISFALGIVARYYGFYFPGESCAALILGSGALWFLRRTRFFTPLLMIVLILAGIFRAHFDGVRPTDAVEHSVSRYKVELRGQVVNQPDVKRKGRRVMASFVLAARSVRSGPRSYKKEKTVRGDVQVFWIQPGFIPEAGDTILLWGQLEKPRSALNPGEFDHAKYLSQKNIFTLVRPIGRRAGTLLAKAPPWSPALWIGRTRSGLAELIDRLYPLPRSAILKALVLGVRSDVGPVIQNAFMKTGTVHLLAISGLNITMIAGSFFLIFLFLRLPKKWTVVLTMMIVVFYVPLAGSGIPVQRAGIMALLVLTAMLLGRPAHLLNALCISFFLLLCIHPKSLWNIGFQLSFLSVLSLVVVLPFLPRHKVLSLSIGGSLAVLIGTSPVVLYFFNTFSPVGVIANLIAIPVFDAALLSALFAVIFCKVPLLGSFLVAVSSGIVTVGLAWIGWLSTWRFGYWFFVRPEAWQLWTYYGALGLALGIDRVRVPMKKFLLGACFLCWGLAAISMFRTDDPAGFRLTVLASGREPVLHVHFSNGADWLINTGRNFPSDQGERLVLPYLRQLGIKRLDGILLTDLRKKHRGGLEAVLRDVSVRRILFWSKGELPADFYRLLKFFKGQKDFLKKGMRLDFGEEKMTILAADESGTALSIETRARKILFISKVGPSTPDLMERTDPEVIILPFLKMPVDEGVLDGASKPVRKLIIAGADPEVFREMDRTGTGYFDLSRTGAVALTAESSGFLICSYSKRPF